MADITFATHPAYDKHRAAWKRHRDLYEGEHRTLTENADYLWPHAFELKEDGRKFYAERMKRTRYLNLLDILVEIWKGIFFQKEPSVPEATRNLLEPIKKNIDGEGNSLFSWLRDEMLPKLLLFGKPIALVEATALPDGATEADAAKHRPFIKLIDPLQFVDWQKLPDGEDSLGGFEWFRYEFMEVPHRANPEAAAVAMVEKCRVYSMNGSRYVVREYQKVKEKIGDKASERWERDGAELLGAIDRIPVVVLEKKSWVKDAAEECLRFFNLRSMYDNQLLHQGYTKHFAVGIDPNNTKQIQALSEYIMGILPTGGDIKTVAPSSQDHMVRAMTDSLVAFFRAGLRKTRELPLDSRESMAADAQAEENRNATDAVLGAIEQLEAFTNKVVSLCAEFLGKKDFDPEIKFSREIHMESAELHVLIRSAFRDAMAKLPTWEKATLKRAARLQNFSGEEYAEIEQEIDAMETGDPVQQEDDIFGDDDAGLTDEQIAEIKSSAESTRSLAVRMGRSPRSIAAMRRRSKYSQ